MNNVKLFTGSDLHDLEKEINDFINGSEGINPVRATDHPPTITTLYDERGRVYVVSLFYGI